jgi:hypothetical protein
LTERELDSLHQVYDQVLLPKDASILDTRQLSFSQVCLYLGSVQKQLRVLGVSSR